jgi:hypothetical protein
MHREVTIAPSAPMPQGYAFLSKGVAFKTLHCRKLTREAGQLLYVVVDNKKTLGLRAPKPIVAQVHQKAKQTLTTRRAVVQKRDDLDIARTTKELRSQFPQMPSSERELILQHGFKKHSRRVGRTASLTLEKKVKLAAIAHLRHTHTEYDTLLRNGQARGVARVAVWRKIESVMREWGCIDGRH